MITKTANDIHYILNKILNKITELSNIYKSLIYSKSIIEDVIFFLDLSIGHNHVIMSNILYQIYYELNDLLCKVKKSKLEMCHKNDFTCNINIAFSLINTLLDAYYQPLPQKLINKKVSYQDISIIRNKYLNFSNPQVYPGIPERLSIANTKPRSEKSMLYTMQNKYII